jgi:hypothetical protein
LTPQERKLEIDMLFSLTNYKQKDDAGNSISGALVLRSKRPQLAFDEGDVGKAAGFASLSARLGGDMDSPVNIALSAALCACGSHIDHPHCP